MSFSSPLSQSILSLCLLWYWYFGRNQASPNPQRICLRVLSCLDLDYFFFLAKKLKNCLLSASQRHLGSVCFIIANNLDHWIRMKFPRFLHWIFFFFWLLVSNLWGDWYYVNILLPFSLNGFSIIDHSCLDQLLWWSFQNSDFITFFLFYIYGYHGRFMDFFSPSVAIHNCHYSWEDFWKARYMLNYEIAYIVSFLKVRVF